MATDHDIRIDITANGTQAERELKSIGKDVNSLADSAKNAALAYVGITQAMEGTKALIDAAEAWEGVKGKIDTVTESAPEAAQALDLITKTAESTRSSIEDTTTVFARLYSTMKAGGTSMEEVARITETVQKSLVIAKAGAGEAASTMLQFSQAMGSGVLRGDEFNSLMENSLPLMQALADGLGKPLGALREMATEGKLTATTVRDALLKMSDSIDDKFNKMPKTLAQATTLIQNDLLKMIGAFNEANKGTETLVQGLEKFRASLPNIGAGILTFTNSIELAFEGAALGVAKSLQFMAERLQRSAEYFGMEELAETMKVASGTMQIAISDLEAQIAEDTVDIAKAWDTAEKQINEASAEIVHDVEAIAAATTTTATNTERETAKIAEAFKALGVKSQKELQDSARISTEQFKAIASSGQASTATIKEAFEKVSKEIYAAFGDDKVGAQAAVNNLKYGVAGLTTALEKTQSASSKATKQSLEDFETTAERLKRLQQELADSTVTVYDRLDGLAAKFNGTVQGIDENLSGLSDRLQRKYMRDINDAIARMAQQWGAFQSSMGGEMWQEWNQQTLDRIGANYQQQQQRLNSGD